MVIFLIAINSNWETESQKIDFNKNEFGNHLTFAVFHVSIPATLYRLNVSNLQYVKYIVVVVFVLF
jgi:hypothetical protein